MGIHCSRPLLVERAVESVGKFVLNKIEQADVHTSARKMRGEVTPPRTYAQPLAHVLNSCEDGWSYRVEQ